MFDHKKYAKKTSKKEKIVKHLFIQSIGVLHVFDRRL